MLKTIFTFLLCAAWFPVFAQDKVFMTDVDNFWVAFDSIQKTSSYSDKIRIINDLYIKKGTRGLHAFMKARDYNDSLWIEIIGKYPKFWQSIRPNTLSVKGKKQVFDQAIRDFQALYPELKPAEIYFTIGGLRSGGTIQDNMVLIGCELATGGPQTDASEFEHDWFREVFKSFNPENIVFVNVHEYVHTQQKDPKHLVLTKCVHEGACDFISELVLKKPLTTSYLTYGRNHADAIKADFKREMLTDKTQNWLYNGGAKGESADLGYYVGYEICKAYYNRAKNKRKAIKAIIELDYADEKAVLAFLKKSKY